MGTRKQRERQEDMWIAAADLPRTAGHPFYERLNGLLMARAQGVSEATVRRIWKQHRLKPHRIETFQLSREPQLLEKLTEVVGLYLNPPDKALVLSVDEKSPIQALDRTQSNLLAARTICA